MAEHRESVKVAETEGYERRQKVVEFAPSTRNVVVSRVNQLIWLFAGIIAVLVALRFVLRLVAANPGNAFADFIYGVTNFLVAPFAGLTNTPALGSGSVVDVASLFAIVVYLLLAWGLTALIRILFAGTNRMRHVKTFEKQDL